MYDLYVPVVDGVEMKFTFEEAKEIALKALAPLGEDYLNLLREGFANGWIDVYENEGKRSGAYSAGARVHPYVLLNFKGTLDDVFTLVHEMGHSIHSYLSNKTQPTGIPGLRYLCCRGCIHLQRGPADGIPAVRHDR